MLNKILKVIDETNAQMRRRVYHQHRLQEEASIGLDELIRMNPAVKTRTKFAEIIGRSKSFVTKILDSHNFTLSTLSDAYFALGYVVHLTLSPRDAGKLRLPVIEDTENMDSETIIPVDFGHEYDFEIHTEVVNTAKDTVPQLEPALV